MTQLFFEHALLPGGWARNVLVDVDGAGIISTISADSTIPALGVDARIAVPGMVNLHSHAFQRAMAGLGEWRGSNSDSFWSWREVMYKFLGRLRPEDLHAVASQLYVEMLEVGFTAVGEFHYVHHQQGGAPYDDPAEMSSQLFGAAEEVGIGMTLLPVFYAAGGFGGIPINDAQRRFYNDDEQFLTLVQASKNKVADNGRHVVGIAPHSLRAVTSESLSTIVEASGDGPIHIHIAEQLKEVEDCVAWSGARPVEWLLNNQDVDSHWCLVHATHMNENEITTLAKSGAVAGLCPATEANLGDGVFAAVAYQEAGGKWGIGTDSHIRICVAEELRSLEYSQRLRDLGRNRLASRGEANGRALFDRALKGGAQALGQPMGSIEVGKYCDVVALDAEHPLFIGKQDDDWLNSWIFSGDKSCIKDVWASGKHVVQNGKHTKRSVITKQFGQAMKHLMT